MYIYVCNLAHFGSALVYLPRVRWIPSLPSFSSHVQVQQHQLWESACCRCFPGVSICLFPARFPESLQVSFFSTHKTCEHHKRLTSSSSGAGIATSGACCRLSAASLLCDLPAERDGRHHSESSGKPLLHIQASHTLSSTSLSQQGLYRPSSKGAVQGLTASCCTWVGMLCLVISQP